MENIDSLFNSDAAIAGLGLGVIIIIGIILFIVHVLICLVPFFMARKRGRSGML